MIAIKYMKEIPSGCDRCRLYPVCKHRDVYNDNYKPTDCPLVEIVTCKDCKHCCHITDTPKVLLCEKHNCQQVSKNFYCADAKRRE